MASERVLIIGASGLLGNWLLSQYARADILATGFSRAGSGFYRLDLTDLHALERLVRDFKPHLVHLVAAMSRPAACEVQPEQAWAVNTAPAGLLARLTSELGFRLVFVSSDLVFDGVEGLYTEEAPVRPLSVYGRTKAAAEKAILACGGDGVVARTSLIIGRSAFGPADGMAWIEELITSGRRASLFVDEFRSPVAAPELARGLRLLAERAEPGIWHLAGPERMSRFELGRLICRAAGWPEESLEPCRQADLAADPPRPRDVSLDVSRVQTLLGAERIKLLEEVLPSSLAGPTLPLICVSPAD